MCVIYINVLGFGHIYRNLLHSHFYFHDLTLHQTISRYRSPVESGWRLMKYRGLRTLIQGVLYAPRLIDALIRLRCVTCL